MISCGETYPIALFKHKENSAYEYEEKPLLTFYGRPARPVERNFYSIQQGINGGVDETFIFASTLPAQVEVGDKVFFMGKYRTVQSVGVYLEATRVVNASVMNPEKLIERAPKGITLQ